MKNKLRVFEAFAGYGSQSIALRNIGIDYEVVAISEIDKYAIKAYESIHGKVNNLGDISKINVEDIPDHDLFTYSFPCQDISVAGKQASLEENSGTRSSLLWECKKIIEGKKPKYLLMENVKNLVSKKHKPYFDKWLEWLEEQGYNNTWKVLNAKDYGIPQNRERVFVVSIFGENFEMKETQSVDGDLQYFLDKNINIKTKPSCQKAFDREFENIVESDKPIYQCNVKSGFQDCKIGLKVSPTIRANNSYTHVFQYNFHNGVELKKNIFDLLEKDIDEKYYLSNKAIEKMKRFAPKGDIIDKICPTLTTELSHHTGKNLYPKLCRIIGTYRRITPKEAFRLMGMSDEDIKKIQSTGISDTQQYKMAGNSIVIQVLEYIFKELFKSYLN